MGYYLTVCAVVKDEALYLEEWIEFHLLQGVEHFFLYENCSNDNTVKILKNYERAGLVTWKTLDANPCQFVAYKDALGVHGNKTKWMAFLDCDEFLFHSQGLLSDKLKGYEQFPGVAARWILFGSNGEEEYREELVINRFTTRAARPDKHVKTILQPARTKSVGKNPHCFYLDAPCVDENRKRLPKEYGVMYGRTANLFRIHHYHTKSKAEYMARKKNPDPGTGIVQPQKRVEEMFHAHDVGEIVDRTLADRYGEVVACGVDLRRVTLETDTTHYPHNSYRQ